MKLCLSDELIREVLKILFSVLGLSDFPILLWVTSSCWDMLKEMFVSQPLLANIDNMKDRITAAINIVEDNKLRGVREEF